MIILHRAYCVEYPARVILKLSDSHASFKKKIKKDQALPDKLSFEKESCLITNKDDDFYYF